MNPVVSSTPEKNCLEMITAREPYRKKSYHSKIVPSDAAKISLRSTVRIVGSDLVVANGKVRVSTLRSLIPMRCKCLPPLHSVSWNPQGWFYRHLTIRLPPIDGNLFFLEPSQ